jgi:RNA polymerase sigma-70 factor, ECF subfamily
LSDVREEIYNSYKIMIFNYFHKAVSNFHTAEDLTEDTFLKAFKHFANFRGESNVKTWLFKIARNTLINHLNLRKCSEIDIAEYPLEDNKDEFSALSEKILITKVLLKLSEEERTFIILRDVNGLTYTEIAQVMSFTEGKVKIGIHRARKKFKEFYTQEWEV